MIREKIEKKNWIATEKIEKRLLPGSGETYCRWHIKSKIDGMKDGIFPHDKDL